MVKKKNLWLVAVLCILLLLTTGCGAPKSVADKSANRASSPQPSAAQEEAGFGAVNDQAVEAPKEAPATEVANEMAKDQAQSAGSGTAVQTVDTGRKIIKSGHIGLETEKFDRTVDAIIGKINTLGGYVETSNIQGISAKQKGNLSRRAHFEARIPSKYFDQFMTDIGQLGNVTSKESNGEDVTGQYFDTEARLKSVRIQEERLLTILQKAERLQDILELERELQQVRYEIENLTGTLKKWDNMVEYSKMSIDVYETDNESMAGNKASIWARMSDGFINSVRDVGEFLENLLVFLTSALPYMLLIAVFVAAVWLLVRFVFPRKPSQ